MPVKQLRRISINAFIGNWSCSHKKTKHNKPICLFVPFAMHIACCLLLMVHVTVFMMTSSNGKKISLLPFVRGIRRSPVNSPHKGKWRGVLMFSLICAWINVRLVIWDAITPIMTSLYCFRSKLSTLWCYNLDFCSTISTGLSALSAMTWHDVIKPNYRSVSNARALLINKALGERIIRFCSCSLQVVADSNFKYVPENKDVTKFKDTRT